MFLSLITIGLVSAIAFYYIFTFFPSYGHLKEENRGEIENMFLYALCEFSIVYTSLWLMSLFPSPLALSKLAFTTFKKSATWLKIVYPFALFMGLSYIGAFLLAAEFIVEQINFWGLLIIGGFNVLYVHNFYSEIVTGK